MLLSRFRVTALLISVFAIFGVFFIKGIWIQTASAEKPTSFQTQGQITARIAQSGRPWINLQDGYESRTLYNGKAALADIENAGSVSLFSADINHDGFPDLITGYASANGGMAVIRFGDPEAFGPTRSETIEGIKNGRFPASFLPDAAALNLPETPDFLAVGDFDRDGGLDILTAARGSSVIYLLSEDKNSTNRLNEPFSLRRKIPLPGPITTLATGRDSISPYDDLAVGVMSDSGAQVLFYSTTQSVFEETPAVYGLSSPANSIAINQLDNAVPTDLAVTTDNDVLVIHGSGEQKADTEDFYQSQIEHLQITALSNVVIGDFIPDRENQMELAVLSNDGTIRIEAYGQPDTRPFTAAEMLEKRKSIAKMRKSGRLNAAVSAWRPENSKSWNEVQTMSMNTSSQNSNSSKAILVSSNIAASAGDELLVVNSAEQNVEILMNDTDLQTGNLVSMRRSNMAIKTENTPIAALPMRLGVMGQPGLVVLTKGTIDPVLMPSAPEAGFDVDRNDDVAGATACTAAVNDCSLRGAISASNANGVGADSITFNASGNAPVLTITGSDNSNANGDLDINGSVTITGNGAATTILGTNFTAASVSDGKIFGVNQNGGINGLAVSFSGVTIQNGFNKTPCGSFRETGGGGDFFLTGTGNAYSMTNVVVKNNTTTGCTASHGGGINVDSTNTATVGGASAGTVTFTSCTFSGNKSDAEGGGLNLAADKHDVNIIGTSVFGGVNAVDGNQATTALNGNGGGIDIEHSFGGTVTIGGTTTVQNNTAARAGGGITVTFNTNFIMSGASILNNTSNSSGSGSAAGGGVVINPTGVAGFTPTITLSGSTINSNVATAGATGQGGGIYFNSPYSATVSNCTISSNSADVGGGVFNAGSSGGATLTINGTGGATTISNNSATISGGGVANVDSNGATTILNGTTNAITIDNNTSVSGGDGIDQTGTGGTGSTMTLQGTVNVNSGDSVFISSSTASGTLSIPGTANITGNLTNAGGTVSIPGTVNLSRDFTFSSGTFSQGSGTVNFNGTVAQQITGGATPTFFNLTDSNTTAMLTVNNSANVNGTLTVNANAVLNPVAAAVIGGTGTLTGNGTVRVTRTAATPDFSSQYTITNKTLTNLLVDYVGTAAQTISALTYGQLRLNNASGASLAAGTTTVNGTLTLANGVLAVGSSTLIVNSNIAVTSGSLTSGATGTVNYNQSADGQIVLAANYGNLTFSNFNKVLPAATIGIAGTFTPGTATGHTVTGSTFNFNGTVAQTIPVFPYVNLTLTNAAGASLGGNVTVNGTLTLANGVLAVGTSTLTLNSTVTATSGSLSSAATGTVNYNQSADGQNVLAANYGNLTFSNFNKTLPAATVGIAGTFTPGTATGHTITGNTINFNGSTVQTIPAFNYNNLTSSSTGGRTLANSGTIGVAGVFTPGTNAYTVTGSTVDFNGAAAQTIPAFTFNNLVTSNGGVKTTSGAVNVNGNATVGTNTTLLVAAASTLTVTGTLTNNGTIQGLGTIVNNFTNGGNLAPGLSPGILSITGTFANTGNFNVEIGGTGGAGVNPNGHDKLLVSGAATLGGTLNVTLTNGFTPSFGNSFVIFDAASLTGTFATTNLPNIAPKTWSVTYNNAAGTVTLSVLAPTAASVSVSGRVLSSGGKPIARARIYVTNSNGTTRSVLSNQFGFYQIGDLASGEDYTVSVKAKSYQFAPRVISLSDSLTDLNFVSETSR